MTPRIFTLLYTLLWTLALPFVFLNKRLQDHLNQRLGREKIRTTYDVWIQAASVGESMLAIALARHLLGKREGLDILISTNTAQGYDILTRHFQEQAEKRAGKAPHIRICPLDHPSIMHRFVQQIAPKVVVLLETELWPGLLGACKKHHCPVLVANARMSQKSFAGYTCLGSAFGSLAPQEIMAISPSDAARFSMLFDRAKVTTMPNIKFDRMDTEPAIPYVANPLSHMFRPSAKLVTLASIREEEEPIIQDVLTRFVKNHPATIVALVPRHEHRTTAWKQFLTSSNMPWVLRSELDSHVRPGTVILWDRFGELAAVYALSKAAFVGGSLAPLGGQNFLEPLIQGVRPIIGPSWENFYWVGQELIEQNMVTFVNNAEELAQKLGIPPSMSREKICAHAKNYLSRHQGGTARVSEKIMAMLDA